MASSSDVASPRGVLRVGDLGAELLDVVSVIWVSMRGKEKKGKKKKDTRRQEEERRIEAGQRSSCVEKREGFETHDYGIDKRGIPVRKGQLERPYRWKKGEETKPRT